MRFSMRSAVVIVMAALLGPTVRAADEPKAAKSFDSLAALHAEHAARLRELDRRRILDLAAFAKSKDGDESDLAYEELFGLAIDKDLYGAAAAAAEIRSEDKDAPLYARAMALLVRVIAKADEGKHEESFALLADFFKANAAQAADPNRPKLPEATAITLGEAYLQRLLASRRYDLARKLGELVSSRADRPALQAHFKARLARLDLLGKPAPDLVGKDIDGKTVKLSDFKGKVVLIEYWASWCDPSLQAIPSLTALEQKYGKDGFVILGVNLDAHREDVGVAKARPIVRRLLVSAGIAWPNIVGGTGEDDPTRPYGVTDIPANFLVGRDGSVVAFELAGQALAKTVAEEVGKK